MSFTPPSYDSGQPTPPQSASGASSANNPYAAPTTQSPNQTSGYASYPPGPGSYPTYQQPAPYYQQPPGTNGMAIAALVLAFFIPLLGAILGHVALSQINKTGEGGRGVALAGVIIGWVYTALTVLFVLFFVGIGIMAVNAP